MSLSNGELDGLLCSPSRLQTLSDAELMDALRSGCNDALAILFERHRALVLQIARAAFSDDEEAEDAVQRAFLDVFQEVKQFNPDRESFKTWLLKYAEPGRGRSLA
jgi:DNA-directed RNA polymerase specialized sigma24 family protein